MVRWQNLNGVKLLLLFERGIALIKRLEKYLDLAKKYSVSNALIISPNDIIFDIRAILKCKWGCNDFFKTISGVTAEIQRWKKEWR